MLCVKKGCVVCKECHFCVAIYIHNMIASYYVRIIDTVYTKPTKQYTLQPDSTRIIYPASTYSYTYVRVYRRFVWVHSK